MSDSVIHHKGVTSKCREGVIIDGIEYRVYSKDLIYKNERGNIFVPVKTKREMVNVWEKYRALGILSEKDCVKNKKEIK